MVGYVLLASVAANLLNTVWFGLIIKTIISGGDKPASNNTAPNNGKSKAFKNNWNP